MAGLLVDAGERGASFLSFDHADGLLVDQQEIIGSAGFQRNLGQSDAARSRRNEIARGLDGPTALDEEPVDILAGLGFRIHG